ncbi:hypothetical protein ACFY93_21875 [Streptomyces sp. NPDC008313]|uniref:hypothetical protein n=1 Tax=Streptomyces sp. NPDC008313 TaxID=3364826 RepID=UPI0036EB8FFE
MTTASLTAASLTTAPLTTASLTATAPMTTAPAPTSSPTTGPIPASPSPRLYVLASGTLASVQRDGRWYLIDTGPGAKAPVLRLAGDTDDEGLEPHICRSID